MEHYRFERITALIAADEYIRDYRDAETFCACCAQCGQYGQRWSCPPYDFDIDDYVSGYRQVMVVGTKIVFEESFRHSFATAQERNDASNMAMEEAIRQVVMQHRQWEERFPKSLAFVAAKCLLCEPLPCTRPLNLPCRHPDMMRHSLESVGFDIGKTAESLLNTPLRWASGVSLPEYLLLVTAHFFAEELTENECFL
ncbi:MAG: DUF2284 domain-containing protein [Prevotella sp.]|nr:DUF2284 domain-containing protein [Prevotella sp.]